MRGEVFVVISYDIPDDKRRLKVAKLLLDYGGQRVQWSVFECYITNRNLDRLRERLLKVFNAEQDSIRFYRLCDACQPADCISGQGTPDRRAGVDDHMNRKS
jgi:CRISPR-associated protein Cas2